MKPGDYGLTTLSGPLGAAIGIGQVLVGDGSRFDHAFIYLGDNQIMEAKPFGARIADLSEYSDRKVVFSNLDLTDEQRAGIVSTARSLEGTPYSFLDYVSIALAHKGIRPKWLKNYIASSKHMICSQVVDYCHFENKVYLFNDNRWFGDVTPGDLTYVGNVQFN